MLKTMKFTIEVKKADLQDLLVLVDRSINAFGFSSSQTIDKKWRSAILYLEVSGDAKDVNTFDAQLKTFRDGHPF